MYSKYSTTNTYPVDPVGGMIIDRTGPVQEIHRSVHAQ